MKDCKDCHVYLTEQNTYLYREKLRSKCRKCFNKERKKYYIKRGSLYDRLSEKTKTKIISDFEIGKKISEIGKNFNLNCGTLRNWKKMGKI